MPKTGRLVMVLVGFWLSLAGFSLIAAESADWAWTSWRNGFETFDQAERNSLEGRQQEALKQYIQALTVFETIQQKAPKWNPEVVDGRIKLCRRRIELIKEKISDEEKKAQKTSTLTAMPAFEGDAEALKKVLVEYREKLFKALGDLEEAKQAASKYRDCAETVKRLLAEKQRQDAELASLRQRVTAAARQAPTPTDELMDTRKQLLTARMRHDELQRANNVLSRQVDSLKKDKDQLQRAENLAKYEQKQLKEKNAAQDDELKRAKEQLSRLQEERQSVENNLARLKQEKAQLKVALNKKFKAYDEVYAQLTALRRSTAKGDDSAKLLVQENDMYRKRNDELKTAADQLNDQLNRLKKDQEEWTLARSTLNDTLSNVEKKRVELENEFKAVSLKYRDLTLLSDHRSKIIAEQKKTLLQQESDLKLLAEKYERDSALRKSYERSAATVTELKEKHRQELGALRQTHEEIAQKLKKTLQQLERRELELSSVRQEIVQLRQQSTEMQQKLAATEQKNVALTSTAEQQKRNFSGQEQQYDVLSQKLDIAQKRLSQLQRQNDKLSKSLALEQKNLSVCQTTNTALERELSAVNTLLRRQQDDIKTLKEAAEHTAKPAAAELVRAQQDQQMITQQKQELAALTEKLKLQQRPAMKSPADDVVMSLKKQNAELQSRNRQLGAALTEQEQQRQKMETDRKEYGVLEGRLTDLKQSLTRMTEANKRLEGQLRNSGVKDELLEKMRLQIADLKTRLKALSPAGLALLQKQNDALTEEIGKLKKQLAAGRQSAANQGVITAKRPEVVPRTAVPASKKTIDFLLAAGKNSFKKKDGESALWHFRKVLSLDPDNYSAMLASGEVLLMMKRWSEAAAILQQASVLQKTAIEPLLMLIQARIELRQFDSAAAEMKKAEILSPGNDRLKLLRGYSAFLQKKMKEAETILRQIPARSIYSPAAKLALSRVLAADPQRKREAVDLYRQARDGGSETDPKLEQLIGGH